MPFFESNGQIAFLPNQEPIPKRRLQSGLTELGMGIAAEHLVCAELMLAGWKAFMTDQNCPYDIAVDVGTLIRIQVKATMAPKIVSGQRKHVAAYMWQVRRAGKGGKRLYKDGEFDLLALVALDIRKIAYFPPSRNAKTIHIRQPGTTGGKQFEHFTFDGAIKELVP